MGNRGGSAKQVIFLIFFVLVVALFIGGYVLKDRQPISSVITTGDRAPDFHLQAPDGRYYDLSAFRGKVVMVHFWATWCPTCVDELPTLEQLYRIFAGSNFEILTISVDDDGPRSVMPFMQKNGLTLPVLFDMEHDVAARYGTNKFPESYIIDREGIVRDKAIGPRDWTNPESIKVLQQLIQG